MGVEASAEPTKELCLGPTAWSGTCRIAGPMKARGPCGGSESSVRPKSRVAQPSLTTGGYYCSAAPLVPTGLPRQRGSTRRTQSGAGRLRAAPDATTSPGWHRPPTTSPGRHRTPTIHQGGTGRQLFTTSELRQHSLQSLSAHSGNCNYGNGG